MRGLGFSAASTIHRGPRFHVLRGTWSLPGTEREAGLPAVAKQALTDEAAEALRREYVLLQRLDGTGVAKALALDERDGHPKLILEDAGPENLSHVLTRGALSIDDFLHLAVPLAETLDRVHATSIVHRDICPENVVIRPPHEPTLVDFDLATDVVAVARARPIDELEGTLATLSPEQTGRMNRVVDARSDLYSLGATFYTMLTGAPPFPDPDPAAIVQAHLSRTPPSPHTVAPHVPRVLATIVERLLAKLPEDRYQSAAALAHDLRRAQTHWSARREIPPFELGLLDRQRVLTLPEGVYGREAELERIREVLMRVRAGSREVIRIIGEPGIGKSALLDAIAAQTDAPVLRGQLDPAAGAPYCALRDAFGTRLAAIARDGHRSAALRRRIAEALGPNSQALVELLPELGWIVGTPAPPAPDRPLDDARRFQLTFVALARALAQPEAPLVLLVDDAQWMDPASLAVLRAITTDAETSHTLSVLAARPNCRACAFMPAESTTLELGPLSLEALTSFVADALSIDRARAAALAAIVHRHSGGVPLLAYRVLVSFHERGLLRHDPEKGWTWDTRKLAAVPLPRRAVDVLVTAIEQLPPQTRAALASAACIGRSFELALLATVRDSSVDECARDLWDALRAGVIVPTELEQASSPAYRFVHDRVQQAAYERLSPEERSTTHQRIGKALLDGEHRDESLFTIVEQLERGSDRIDTDEDAIALAALEREAGRRARAAMAWDSALGLFERGMGRLPESAWETHRDLAFGLHRDAVECCYVTGDPERLESIARRAEAKPLSALERAELSRLRILALTQDGRFAEAVAHGRSALARLGVTLPEQVSEGELRVEIERTRAKLAERGIETLVDWPRTDDPFLRVKSLLLGETATPLYFIDPDLSTFADVMVLPLTLDRGATPEAPTSLIAVGRYLAAVRGEWREADRIAGAAIELARRSDDRARESQTLINVAIFIQPWHAPLRSCTPLLSRAFQLAMSSGAMTIAAYARTSQAIASFAAGEPLAAVEVEAAAARELGKRIGNPIGTMAPTLILRAVRTLRSGHLFEPEPHEEDALMLQHIASSPVSAHYRELLRLELAIVFKRFDEACRHARACERYAPFVRGMMVHARARFFGALACAASEGPAALERLGAERNALARWARGAPENFAFMERALAAEIARIEGRDLDAAELYDEASELASEQRALEVEAILSERAASHHASRGRRRAAALHLASARDTYARWGAAAKVRMLDARLPPLVGLVPAREARARVGELTAVRRAADESISALEWEPLVERILSATRDLAGATRTALVLTENGQLTVRGVLEEGEQRASPTSTLLQRGVLLVASIVEEALRSGEPVQILDAHDTSSDDPYLESHDVRSVLAVPIQRHSVRVGVLYLEHRVSPRAFDPQQVIALELLASHVATALENNALFSKLRQEVDERRRTEERVRFLLDASTALSESLDLEETLGRVAQLSVERITEYCAIDLFEGERVERLAEACARGRPAALDSLPRTFTPPADSPIAQARRGKAVWIPVLSGRDLAQLASDSAHHDHLLDLGLRGLATVPITAHGQVLGALSFASARRGIRYGAIDVRLAEELAARVARAVANARLYRAATEAVRVRDEFLSVASHELRGPVSALQLTLQGLGSGLFAGKPPPGTERPLAIAERQALRLGRLVGELLDVSRLRTQKLVLHLEEVGLDELVREVAERFEGELETAGCKLEVDIPPGIVGHWDPSRLSQVVENLLSNAIKFGRGKPIEVRGARVDGMARLTVRDHGVGIPAERMPHIFDRFERAVSAAHFGGLGLGLYIVKEIVCAMDGHVRAESIEGEGATFTVELPLEGPAEDRDEVDVRRSA